MFTFTVYAYISTSVHLTCSPPSFWAQREPSYILLTFSQKQVAIDIEKIYIWSLCLTSQESGATLSKVHSKLNLKKSENKLLMKRVRPTKFILKRAIDICCSELPFLSLLITGRDGLFCQTESWINSVSHLLLILCW